MNIIKIIPFIFLVFLTGELSGCAPAASVYVPVYPVYYQPYSYSYDVTYVTAAPYPYYSYGYTGYGYAYRPGYYLYPAR